MQEINRKNLQTLAEEIEEAVQAVAQRHGVKIERGRGQYGGAFATLKLEIATVDESGAVHSKEAEAFKANADLFGLSPDDLGREFTNHNATYRITGAKPQAQKYPILAERVKDGRTFKFPAEAVSMLLKRESA